MLPIQYIFSRLLRKLRGSAVLDSVIHPTSVVESGSTIIRTSFGRHSFCGYDCTFIDCEVGAFCSIGNRVIAGGARHPIEFVSTSPVFLSHKDSVKTKYSRHPYNLRPRTAIGNDVWIGENVLIKGGVSIGHGAVIGMGSVVTKDVPPYAIVGGNPAKLLRVRFEPAVVGALLRLEWWNLPDSELLRLAPQFTDPTTMLRDEGLL